MDEPISDRATGPVAVPRRLAGTVVLALLPALLAVVGYFRHPADLSTDAIVGRDECYHIYQLERARELSGRWWKIPDDPLTGRPYQTGHAHHPGLYEGVDLMLLSTLTGRFLDAKRNLLFVSFAVLLVNGWVAGWLIRRLTGSTLWAAVGVSLVTLNYQTGYRLQRHLHLFKYGWSLLAVWAFWRFLREPSHRRGVVLGLAMAWAFQGTFYFGYFLALGLGTWWLGCLVAGRLGRRHAVPTLVAGATFLTVSFALTFPLWTINKGYLRYDDVTHRSFMDTWRFSGELWQYVVAPSRDKYNEIIAQTQGKPEVYYNESGYFPGYTVLAGVALYLVARLRGIRPCARDPEFLDLIVGLMGIYVVLSLAGGPSIFLYGSIQSVRCYGRAGILVMVLGCVATPVVLHGVAGRLGARSLRLAFVAAAVGLTGVDAYSIQRWFQWLKCAEPVPAWVHWLARQPADVKLAAFPLGNRGPSEVMGPFYYRSVHRHATLNGADDFLLWTDLSLLGCRRDHLSLDGLRFVVSLGYDTLAFDDAFLADHPWIGSVPWLAPVERVGDWQIYRAGPRAPRFPVASPEALLSASKTPVSPVEVPARAWITGQLDVPERMVALRSPRVRAAWSDERGRRVGQPARVLGQHIYGPDLPAFVVQTPRTPGRYDLDFIDDCGRRLASRPFVVRADLPTSRAAFPDALPDLQVNGVRVEGTDGQPRPPRLELENASPYYLQAQVARGEVAASMQGLPGVGPFPGSLALIGRLSRPDGRGPDHSFVLALPRDLPPGGRLTVEVPEAWPREWGGPVVLEVWPHFLGLGQRFVGGQELAAIRLGPASTPALVRGRSPSGAATE
jgi:hypothetical protein